MMILRPIQTQTLTQCGIEIYNHPNTHSHTNTYTEIRKQNDVGSNYVGFFSSFATEITMKMSVTVSHKVKPRPGLNKYDL